MSDYTAESLDCFASLTDKIPSWISRVSELATHTAAKQEEFRIDYIKYSNQGKRSRRLKDSSLHTNRPEDEGSGTHSSSLLDPEDPCSEPLTRMKMLKQVPGDVNHRKRRTHGDDSTEFDEDAERTVRARPQFLIHYDFHTQAVLEKLVREIGGARNYIRKGRMSYMMKSGFGRKVLPTGFSSDDGMKPIFRSTRQISRSSATKDSPFDLADTHLESAQGLCEIAAHQFLRNGDCSLELDRTKEKLGLALGMAKVEVERLTEEARIEREAEAEAAAKEKEKQQKREAERLDAEHKKSEKGEKDMKGSSNAIEVDDASDTSSISIDITAFRSSRFRR
ncbi:hypothetical protein PRK78_003190 [Emydomyces testavorans]|uniref:Uncharacterized protein n=1 Tax=Emydomyces testavorans TaxID=2070801 RepID=A0AAF0DGC7_9EURO|nr:hypothetical protein PRK78_003190 [Emydomyces testavorans]